MYIYTYIYMIKYFFDIILLTTQKSVFSLKEQETQLAKHKGIVQQAVKDVIEELASDNLIERDKIGSGNYYWCFPSKALSIREKKNTQLREQIKDLEHQLEGMFYI